VRVVVVGSGLAAAGAIRGLLSRKIRPVVLDIGATLPDGLDTLRQTMSEYEPNQWNIEQRESVSRNDSTQGRVVPRKLVMGSDYFYSSDSAVLSDDSEFVVGPPPWSPARGGFSVGWGAAALPPAASDLADWPIGHNELLENARIALEGIPVSEPKDQLTQIFGALRPDDSSVVPLSDGQTRLLAALQKRSSMKDGSQTLVGQSRLLTQGAVGVTNSCRRCGLCSSSCVYGSIYSAEQDIIRWAANGQIDYRSDSEVFKVKEVHNGVIISYRSSHRNTEIEADRVFLASGAVNTARVLANSAPCDLSLVSLQRTGGVLQLFAGIRHFTIAWPEVNTQTSHMIEMLRKDLSPYWAHVQLGQPNELVLRRLGVSGLNHLGVRQRLTKFAAGHLVTTMLNLNSFHGPRYEMQLHKRSDRLADVRTRQTWTIEGRDTLRRVSRELAAFMKGAGFFRLPFVSQDSSAAQGYHFGASFPMIDNPTKSHETDILGRPFDWKRVHIVDTSVLPRIPSTGIGVVTMANSYRIASSAVLASNK